MFKYELNCSEISNDEYSDIFYYSESTNKYYTDIQEKQAFYD